MPSLCRMHLLVVDELAAVTASADEAVGHTPQHLVADGVAVRTAPTPAGVAAK